MKNCVLGGGVTGLAAGMASGFPVYEAGAVPGGICGSYYVRPGESEHLEQTPADEGAYRFEVGGGHWIFGGDPVIRQLIGSLTRVKSYHRRSAVYFPSKALLVPYPLQNHLHYLGNDIAAKALREMLSPAPRPAMTQADWLLRTFGPTLTHLFFGPFHELYTAGLWRRAAPQDSYKSPVNLTQVRQGAFGEIDSESSGYNASFLYPEKGLDVLVRRMARDADVHCRQGGVRVAPGRRAAHRAGGGGGRVRTAHLHAATRRNAAAHRA